MADFFPQVFCIDILTIIYTKSKLKNRCKIGFRKNSIWFLIVNMKVNKERKKLLPLFDSLSNKIIDQSSQAICRQTAGKITW